MTGSMEIFLAITGLVAVIATVVGLIKHPFDLAEEYPEAYYVAFAMGVVAAIVAAYCYIGLLKDKDLKEHSYFYSTIKNFSDNPQSYGSDHYPTYGSDHYPNRLYEEPSDSCELTTSPDLSDNSQLYDPNYYRDRPFTQEPSDSCELIGFSLDGEAIYKKKPASIDPLDIIFAPYGKPIYDTPIDPLDFSLSSLLRQNALEAEVELSRMERPPMDYVSIRRRQMRQKIADAIIFGVNKGEPNKI